MLGAIWATIEASLIRASLASSSTLLILSLLIGSPPSSKGR